MDDFGAYGKPAASQARVVRNGTPASYGRDSSTSTPNGSRVEIFLGQSPVRRGQTGNISSGSEERGYSGNHDGSGSGIVSSSGYPRAKRKAEASYGLSPAVQAAVKNAVAAATSEAAAAMPRKKPGRPKGWKPGMAYSQTTNHPRSEAAKLLYIQRRMREDPNYRPRGQMGDLAGVPQGKRRGRPPGPERSVDRPVSRPVGKLVGRPVGRPPGSGSGAMNGPPKPRGRPPKKPPPTPREIYRTLKPRFEAYRCEWSGCEAELHNMATLRAHVHKVHGGSHGCRWAACGEKPVTAAPDAPGVEMATAEDIHATSPPTSVLSGERLSKHVEQKHLVPIQWARGDGFKTGPISSTKSTTTASYNQEGDPPPVPSYLLDKDGNQVTPWVWNQKLEDNATRLANKKRLLQTLLQMNEDAPSEEDDEDSVEDGK